MKTLNCLAVGEKVVIKNIPENCRLRERFCDIGLIENTPVECVGESPLKNPRAYLIRGAVIAIRNEDCNEISVVSAKEDENGTY